MGHFFGYAEYYLHVGNGNLGRRVHAGPPVPRRPSCAFWNIHRLDHVGGLGSSEGEFWRVRILVACNVRNVGLVVFRHPHTLETSRIAGVSVVFGVDLCGIVRIRIFGVFLNVFSAVRTVRPIFVPPGGYIGKKRTYREKASSSASRLNPHINPALSGSLTDLGTIPYSRRIATMWWDLIGRPCAHSDHPRSGNRAGDPSALASCSPPIAGVILGRLVGLPFQRRRVLARQFKALTRDLLVRAQILRLGGERVDRQKNRADVRQQRQLVVRVDRHFSLGAARHPEDPTEPERRCAPAQANPRRQLARWRRADVHASAARSLYSASASGQSGFASRRARSLSIAKRAALRRKTSNSGPSLRRRRLDLIPRQFALELNVNCSVFDGRRHLFDAREPKRRPHREAYAAHARSRWERTCRRTILRDQRARLYSADRFGFLGIALRYGVELVGKHVRVIPIDRARQEGRSVFR